jgi:Ca2+-binding RTX toxin-like protein
MATIIGTNRAETLRGTPLADIIRGLAGNDNILGAAGNDRLFGDAGRDLIFGDVGNDLLFGGDGNDLLYGAAGNDQLNGGVGADRMSGGAGDDLYVVDNIADLVVELPGGGIDTVRSSVTYTLNARAEHLTLTGAAHVNGTGNTLGNVINGNAGNNILNGSSGNDKVSGFAGGDRLLGGSGIDVLFGDEPGQTGADTLDGGPGGDTMFGRRGNDVYVVDNAGDQVIETDANPLFGGFDTVRSAITFTLPGNVEDLQLTGAANISGIGNNLANVLSGNAGNNLLDGDGGQDELFGLGGNDLLLGGPSEHSDTLDGGDGNDILLGGARGDDLTGGAGADRFVVQAPSESPGGVGGQDHILDFSRAQGDKIEVSAIDAIASTPAVNEAFVFDTDDVVVVGELDVILQGGQLFIGGETDGDPEYEFLIRIDGDTPLASDFVL